MEVLLVEPGQYAKITTIDRSLEGMQRAVGGYIEAIYPFEDAVAIICDEEGKINGKPLNRALRDDEGRIWDAVAGTFFVCGLGEYSFDDLPKELQDKYEKLFHQPEVFVRMSKGVVAIPTEPERKAMQKRSPQSLDFEK